MQIREYDMIFKTFYEVNLIRSTIYDVHIHVCIKNKYISFFSNVQCSKI